MYSSSSPLAVLSSASSDQGLVAPKPSSASQNCNKRQLRARTMQRSDLTSQLNESTTPATCNDDEKTDAARRKEDESARLEKIRHTWENAEQQLIAGNAEARSIVFERLRKLSAMLEGQDPPKPEEGPSIPAFHVEGSASSTSTAPLGYPVNAHYNPSHPSVGGTHPGYYLPMMFPMHYGAVPVHPYLRHIPYNHFYSPDVKRPVAATTTNPHHFADDSHTKFVVSTGPPTKRPIWRYRRTAKCSLCDSKNRVECQKSDNGRSLCSQCRACSPTGPKMTTRSRSNPQSSQDHSPSIPSNSEFSSSGESIASLE